MSWADTEFETLDLGDQRLNKRAIKLLDDFSAKPTASIPQACGDWADTQAAYRFFANENVDWQDILAPHIKNSVARMAAHDVVLCIQDTTELDFNGQKASGLGPLSSPFKVPSPYKSTTYVPQRCSTKIFHNNSIINSKKYHVELNIQLNNIKI